MTIDFTTLTGAKTVSGSIQNWVNRSDIPIVDILTEAEAFIFQRLRTQEMLASSALTILEGTNSIALQSDFLDPIEFKPYESNVGLAYVHEAELLSDRDSAGALFDGVPIAYAILNNVMVTGVNALQDFSGIMTYYAQPAALSGSNETNWVTTKYPTMLRRSCLRFAYEFMKDAERMATEEILALRAIEEANAANELFRRAQEHPSARYY
jgi:hypothetical protein